MEITETPFLVGLKEQENYNHQRNDKNLSRFLKGILNDVH